MRIGHSGSGFFGVTGTIIRDRANAYPALPSHIYEVSAFASATVCRIYASKPTKVAPDLFDIVIPSSLACVRSVRNSRLLGKLPCIDTYALDDWANRNHRVSIPAPPCIHRKLFVCCHGSQSNHLFSWTSTMGKRSLARCRSDSRCRTLPPTRPPTSVTRAHNHQVLGETRFSGAVVVIYRLNPQWRSSSMQCHPITCRWKWQVSGVHARHPASCRWFNYPTGDAPLPRRRGETDKHRLSACTFL